MDDKLRFFTRDRLDLVVKCRLFRTMQTPCEPDTAVEMYRKHILARTGGIEPGSPTKATIEHYLVAAWQLYAQMIATGFDTHYPILVDQRGHLRDGAHRLACATFLQLEIKIRIVRREFPVRRWGVDWFLTHGFSPVYVYDLLEDANRITAESPALFCQPPCAS